MSPTNHSSCRRARRIDLSHDMFLSFCHNSCVWQKDGQIGACSTVKMSLLATHSCSVCYKVWFESCNMVNSSQNTPSPVTHNAHYSQTAACFISPCLIKSPATASCSQSSLLREMTYESLNQTDSHTETTKYRDRQTETAKYKDRQTDRQKQQSTKTDRQTDRQTDRPSHHICRQSRDRVSWARGQCAPCDRMQWMASTASISTQSVHRLITINLHNTRRGRSRRRAFRSNIYRHRSLSPRQF